MYYLTVEIIQRKIQLTLTHITKPNSSFFWGGGSQSTKTDYII